MLKRMIATSASTVAFPLLNFGSARVLAADSKEYSNRAVELVGRSFPIDLKHALSLHPDELKSWLTDPDAFGEDVWRAFRDSGLKVIQTTLETTDNTLLDYAWHNGFLAAHRDRFVRISSASDFDKVVDNSMIGMILGCENSTHFTTLEDIELYYGLGQRISQLTFNSQNLIGSGATERTDGGLSDYGVAVVERMNKIGMAVDLSHCGDRTTLDALAISKRPVIMTHTVARALNPSHPRTKSDEMIRGVAATGGVMGIGFLRVFVRDREPTTVEHAIDHFEHVIKLVGLEHVAIGSDIALFGYDSLPPDLVAASKANLKPGTYNFRDRDDIDGLNHPQRLYDLTEGLIRRGYSNENIELILGGNARRALTDAWQGA
jgi:membrane dipeptidase